MGVSRTKLALLFIKFFKDKKARSFNRMAESAELDTKTLRSWYNEEIKNINRNKFDDFITSLKDDAFANFNELSDYIDCYGGSSRL